MNTKNTAKIPALPYNLFLIGFMGTGKSTVAAELNRLLLRPVLEMDAEIERQQGMSIPEIFSRYGEAWFRDLETRLLVEVQKGQKRIISCGGGVAMRKKNVCEMKKSGVVILLTALPETILARVQDDNNRPLLKNRKNTADIAALMASRNAAYTDAADLTIATDGKTAAQIAQEILKNLPIETTF